MKRLLRSIIDVRGVSQENLVFNFTKLMNSKIEWGRQDDTKIYNFVYQYFSGQLEMPTLGTVKDYFERLDDLEVTERLKDIEAAECYIRTNFTYLLTQLKEEQGRLKAVALLKETHDILTRGLGVEGQKERLIGLDAAYRHFVERGRALLDATGRAKEDHDIRAEAPEVAQEYLDAEAHPERRFGAFSGLLEMDEGCGGARPGELWVHGAYPGEMKSSFSMNYGYNAVTRYKRNVVYVSLEMPADQIRRGIYALHSENPKWQAMGWDAGPLDYRKVRDGQLSREEREFYIERVVPDFQSNSLYCEFHVLRPTREKTMPEIQTDLELLDGSFEVGLVIIDHGQWVEAQRHRRNRDYTIELNSVVRDAKSLAMTFARGRRVPVLLLWQINREGKDEADKNDGEYKLKAFTYANEVEKTADVVTTSYLNQALRDTSRVRFGNLKNRDNPRFKTFDARVQWGPRRITSLDRCGAPESGMEVDLASV